MSDNSETQPLMASEKNRDYSSIGPPTQDSSDDEVPQNQSPFPSSSPFVVTNANQPPYNPDQAASMDGANKNALSDSDEHQSHDSQNPGGIQSNPNSHKVFKSIIHRPTSDYEYERVKTASIHSLSYSILSPKSLPALKHHSLLLRFQYKPELNFTYQYYMIQLQRSLDGLIEISITKSGTETEEVKKVDNNWFPIPITPELKLEQIIDDGGIISQASNLFRDDAIRHLEWKEYSRFSFNCQKFILYVFHRLVPVTNTDFYQKLFKQKPNLPKIIDHDLSNGWKILRWLGVGIFIIFISLFFIIVPSSAYTDPDIYDLPHGISSHSFRSDSCSVIDLSGCDPQKNNNCQITPTIVNARTVYYTYSPQCSFEIFISSLNSTQTCSPNQIPGNCSDVHFANFSCCAYDLFATYKCLVNASTGLLYRIQSVDPNIDFTPDSWTWIILILFIFLLPLSALFLCFSTVLQICNIQACCGRCPNPAIFFEKSHRIVLFIGYMLIVILSILSIVIDVLLDNTSLFPGSKGYNRRLIISIIFGSALIVWTLVGFGFFACKAYHAQAEPTERARLNP